MEIDKVFGIFDSLVTPVAIYGSPFWLPFSLPQKSFRSKKNYWNAGKHFNVKN